MHSLHIRDLDSDVRWIELPGDGPGDVYLHGLGCAGSADFTHIATHPHLIGRRAIIVDLLGHGHSDRPENFSYSLVDHAEVVAAVLDTCGLRDGVLIGHSMGGAIAILLAEQRPELFSRVILAEPNLHAGGGMFSGPIASYSEHDFVAHGYRSVLDDLAPAYGARMRISDPRAVHRSAVALVRAVEPDMAVRLLGIPHKRVVIIGARSRPYPDESEILASGIPILEVPHAGHDMMHDNPSGFAAALSRALVLEEAPARCPGIVPGQADTQNGESPRV